MTPLKQARLQARLSQRQLAERARVSAMTVHNTERGLSTPQFDNQRRLASALDRPLDELFPISFDAEVTPTPA